jgi:hypothetical protein
MKRKQSLSRPRAPLARYVNYFELGHNPYEFLIDFGQYQPESEDVVFHTRIALGPTHAKLLAGMLGAAIERHEAEHGRLPDPADPLNPLDVILRSLPDFERRAVSVRRRGAAAAIPESVVRPTTAKR